MAYTRERAITKDIGIMIADLPKKYLGVKLVIRRVTKEVVLNVVDLLTDKLNHYRWRIIFITP